MSQITTHVLDTARGLPAAGIAIELAQLNPDGKWLGLAQGITNEDGRIAHFLNHSQPLTAGFYRMHFALESYFAEQGQAIFYPWAEVVFKLDGSGAHYHIPLLLSPYGYSTYRGS
jgi:5-hydroxyisourate hydrolase